jgi:hypothetical protein
MSIYGYRDITDVTFFDTVTGNPTAYIDYLKTASQAFGNEIIYVTSGRGAPKVVGFQSMNEVKLDITAGLLSPELLSLLFGTTLTVGSQNVPITQTIVATGNTFTLAATPVVGDSTPITVAYAPDGKNPSIHFTKVEGTPTATQFAVSTGTVTVNSTTYASGGTFLVTYYKASTASNKRLKFQSDKFTSAYKVTGYTLWKNANDGKLYPCRITIPLLQIEISGTTLQSVLTGDATTLQFGGQALKTNTSTDLIIYDIDEGEVVG